MLYIIVSLATYLGMHNKSMLFAKQTIIVQYKYNIDKIRISEVESDASLSKSAENSLLMKGVKLRINK